MEKRSLTCVICPLGCQLEVLMENSKVTNVEGYGCKRGVTYAETECINPCRVLTTTLKVIGGQFTLVPVKSEKPIPKGLLHDCMRVLNSLQVSAPVRIGDILIEDILCTGINIIATGNVGVKTEISKYF